MIKYCSPLTGSKEQWINALPWLLLVAAALGAIVATVLRRREPVEYAHMGDVHAAQRLGEPSLSAPAPAGQLAAS